MEIYEDFNFVNFETSSRLLIAQHFWKTNQIWSKIDWSDPLLESLFYYKTHIKNSNFTSGWKFFSEINCNESCCLLIAN